MLSLGHEVRRSPPSGRSWRARVQRAPRGRDTRFRQRSPSGVGRGVDLQGRASALAGGASLCGHHRACGHSAPSRHAHVREPLSGASGGITIDHPSCAPWPTNPLSSQGELTVVRPHGQPGFSRDALNLRVPFKCEEGRFTVLDLAFVTPLSNVKEIHVVEDAEEVPIAGGSSEPALQAHPWEL